MTGGTYTLVLSLPEPATIEVGALGVHAFDDGWYAYTGSALGTGGFARVDRHRALASGERAVRHWHVDYLLCHPASTIESVVETPGEDVECDVATQIGEPAPIDGEPIPRFGASDCDCRSHLAFAPDRTALERSVRAAHAAHGSPHSE